MGLSSSLISETMIHLDSRRINNNKNLISTYKKSVLLTRIKAFWNVLVVMIIINAIFFCRPTWNFWSVDFSMFWYEWARKKRNKNKNKMTTTNQPTNRPTNNLRTIREWYHYRIWIQELRGAKEKMKKKNFLPLFWSIMVVVWRG